ncbi:hypothetical protein ACNHYB_03050 [Isoptericola jiangsuensis]|uniref:hypothetical protein n=1 Tax=Isoptericola jiangsuensis TaxID=548579 RepID=UPI003AAE9448
MAMALRTEIDLPTLRISLDLATSAVVFSTVRGRDGLREAGRCPVEDLGLTRSVFDRVEDAVLDVPAPLVGRLTETVTALGASPVRPYNALWLEIPAPRGLLPVVPWERLLAPLGRPLYRLPFHPVRPRRPAGGLAVALVVSTPSVPGAVARTARAVVEQYRHHVPQVVVHVFTDSASCPAVQETLVRHGAPGEVVVHVPGDTHGSAHATGSELVTNPWLRWLLDAADGDRLDIVHIVAPGCLEDGRGSLALPDPSDPAGAEAGLVESVEIVELLTRVGAIGLTLATPGTVHGAAGLRELADDVARLRPGLTAVHDLSQDPDAVQLAAALRTVLSPSDEAAVLPAMTAWLNPLFLDPVPEPGATGEDSAPTWAGRMRLLDDGGSAFLPETTRLAAVEQTDAWVASAVRSIEQLQMAWLPATADRPADAAAVEALSRVARLLDEHLPPTPAGGSTEQSSAGGSR